MFLGLAWVWWACIVVGCLAFVVACYQCQEKPFFVFLNKSKLDSALFVAMFLAIVAQGFSWNQEQREMARQKAESRAALSERLWQLKFRQLQSFNSALTTWTATMYWIKRNENELARGMRSSSAQAREATVRDIASRFLQVEHMETTVAAARGVFSEPHIDSELTKLVSLGYAFLGVASRGSNGSNFQAELDSKAKEFKVQIAKVTDLMITECRMLADSAVNVGENKLASG